MDTMDFKLSTLLKLVKLKQWKDENIPYTPKLILIIDTLQPRFWFGGKDFNRRKAVNQLYQKLAYNPNTGTAIPAKFEENPPFTSTYTAVYSLDEVYRILSRVVLFSPAKRSSLGPPKWYAPVNTPITFTPRIPYHFYKDLPTCGSDTEPDPDIVHE